MEKEHGSKFTEKAVITDGKMACYTYSSTQKKREFKSTKVSEKEKDGVDKEQPVSPAESLLVRTFSLVSDNAD